MNLYFELKKINEKQGTIRAILIQQGTKAIISTGQKIDIKDWKDGNPKAIGRNSNINLYLNKFRTAFEEYITKTRLANELPSLNRGKEYIKSTVKTSSSEHGTKDISTLITLFKSEKEGFMAEGALKPFTTLLNHLTDFNPKVQFADFDKDFSHRFAKFLSQKSKHVKGATDLQNPTINKMIVTLKVFCKWAFEKRHTSATEWIKIARVKETDQRIITLTAEELYTYYSFDFGKRINLERAKDVFCFASFLGLRYNDLKQVSKSTVKNGYLHINTHKTKTELKIKVVPQAQQILAKYDYNLPLEISNQKLNKNIKESVRVAGIDRKESVIIQHLTNVSTKEMYVHKLISIHDARKTFISLCLHGGLNMLEVMKMSTHSNYKSFLRYVSIEQSKVDEKLESVFGYLKVV